jgi:hypothetical protein
LYSSASPSIFFHPISLCFPNIESPSFSNSSLCIQYISFMSNGVHNSWCIDLWKYRVKLWLFPSQLYHWFYLHPWLSINCLKSLPLILPSDFSLRPTSFWS